MINFFQNQTDEKDLSLSLTLGSSSSSSAQNQTDEKDLSLSLTLGSSSSSSAQNQTDEKDLSLSLTLGSSSSSSPACYVSALSSSSSNSFVGSTLRLALPSPLSSNSFGESTSPTPNQTPPSTLVTPINATVDRSGSESAGSRESLTIAPPYPWATNVRGKIHTLEYLESNKITTITGKVQCQHCENTFQVSYNVRERFEVLKNIFAVKKESMRERALDEWKTPEATRCEICGRKGTVKPVIAEGKKHINWLFLLLGQTLGHCRMGDLKYFCKHSKSHCSGAKDRILYLTYLGLCKMLQPNNPLFNRLSD